MAHTGLSTSQPADTDDDNDGELDTAETSGCELIADCDGDGHLDGSDAFDLDANACLLYTSPSPRDKRQSRMPSSA